MSQNSRRAFLKSGTMLAGLTALNPMDILFKDKNTLNRTLTTSPHKFQLIHSAGIGGQLSLPQSHTFGGLQRIEEQIQSMEFAPLLVDAGDFLDPAGDYSAHLNVLEKLKGCGYHFLSLGKTEWNMAPEVLKRLIQESGIAIIGSNLERIGLEKGKDFYENAIVTIGKYRIGVLAINDSFSGNSGELNKNIRSGSRAAQYLKLLKNCDLVIALSNYTESNSASFRKSIACNSTFIDFVLDGQTKQAVPGVKVLKTSQNKELWHAQVADKGRFITVLEIQMNSNYHMSHVANRSGVPGNSNPKFLAQLHSESFINKI